ncbi:MAG: AMP-binding protein [Desulfobulbaceae bacterium]|nr:AMP-binding protein [Desulfobulbaceae bacterium]
MKKKNDSANTLNSLLDLSCQRFSSRPALSMAFQKSITFGEFHDKVFLLATVLRAAGIRAKDKVAILAENSPNWAIAYFAIVRLGAIAVPILPDFLESDVRHILIDAHVKMLFVTRRQIEKIYELADHHLKKIITLDNTLPAVQLDLVETFDTFLNRGETLSAEKREKIKTVRAVSGDDLASIIYTSGTSGHSKAVMLRHANLYANVSSANQLFDARKEWTFLSILPMSHTYEFTIGFLLPFLNGARVVYAGKSPTPTILERICRKEKPEVMCVVPMVMEKIYKKRVLAAIENNILLKWATRIPFLRKKIHQKIGRKLIDFFGGRLKLFAIGGAPMNIETGKFLFEAGFPYLFGYGLTETSPLLSGGPLNDPTIAVGTTGKPVPGVEIKIVDPDSRTGIGEIHARGPNVMKGYYNNPKATKETIDSQGWLATGDLGKLDPQNNLMVTGRSKSVIVLSHGENIFPETVEEKINSDIHVVESLVIENNNRLEARVYLDYDLIDQRIRRKTPQQRQEHIDQIFKKLHKSVNAQLPAYSRIHKMIERKEPFIKTATHKIKRYLYTN